jgi:bacteriochlorophyll 4-vinyl reductase
MRESNVGRVLVASLHQAIADIVPTRLAFYENWLNTEGLREGTIGLAPLYAVLSFLRQEGELYHVVTARAGEYAAEWTVQSLPAVQRLIIKTAPVALRPRLLLPVAARLVHRTYQGSRALSRIDRGAARIDLRASIFCTVREPVAQPLCGFYSAAYGRLMQLFEIPAEVRVVDCRGTGNAACVLNILLAKNGAKLDS